MTIGMDISQAVYGTGVSDYTVNLFTTLQQTFSNDIFIPVGFSLRRKNDLLRLFPSLRFYPIPPKLLDKIWNRLHLTNFETFSGYIDIYHSSDWTQAPSKAKKITTIHDLAPIIYPQEHDPEIVSVHKRRLSWVVSECDAIICVSQNTANDFLRLYNYPRNQVFVIPEAVPLRFHLSPQSDQSTKYILAIGARQPRKNIQRLISAYQKYAKEYHLPKLIIAGETVFTSSTNIEFLGYVSDQKLVNLLANTSCFVYPSIYEGFGLPLLAALRFKVPVACSDIPVFHEVAKESVTYFDPHSEEEIIKAISRAKVKPFDTNQYSWKKTATKTMEVYKKLCL